MDKLWHNSILRGIIVYVAGYWAIGALAPGPWFSAFLAAMLLIAGLILLLSYAPDAFAVIRDGRIGDDRLALLGLFALAAGSVYSGVFTLLWTYAGNPAAWLGTASSGFGRSMMVGGFGLLTLSPHATREGVRWPRWPLIVITVIVVAVVAFLLGMHWRSSNAEASYVVRNAPIAMASAFRPPG